MKTFDDAVYQDKKIQDTLSMLEQGKTKEEIAKHFGHAVSGLNQYFYRRGFCWNGNTYVPKENESITASDEAKFLTTKAGQIVRLLSQKYANIKQVATKNGFSTVEEMGEYMKGQGFVWDEEKGNYEYDETIVQKQRAEMSDKKEEISFSQSNTSMKDYESILAYLYEKREKLFALLEKESDGTLPRYKFQGAKANKTLSLPTTLQTLLNDFSKEFNVTQRDIIEVSLAEFFKKYGYEDQLNSVLQA